MEPAHSETVSASGLQSKPPPEIRVTGMTKRFGELLALDDVSMSLAPGSVHALLGENGAGKSTLVKCVMGYHTPDAGAIAVDGVVHQVATPRDAHSLGIGMVYQHFTLVPNMSVAENLLIARADIPPMINWQSETERMKRFLQNVPFRIDLDAPTTSLSAGEKQKVEILKQLFLDCQVLILDEPTSVLTPQEADEILGLLSDMAHQGSLNVLLITHKLREVVAFADDVTVLRHGKVVGRGKVGDLGASELTEMMVGAHDAPPPAQRQKLERGEVRLRVEKLCVDNDRGHTAVDAVSFDVSAGEIVGIAGVSGNGQRELVEVLAGQRPPKSGRVLLHGEPYHATRQEMRDHKLSCLPEEPMRNACVGRMSVAENMAFRNFDLPPVSGRMGFIRMGAIRRNAVDLIETYRVRTASPDAAAETLSGGNVQRMVLARELAEDVQVLIVANPCFGLDIRAIAEIRDRIMKARNREAAVLLVSEDLDELFELADRILVIFGGRIVADSPIASSDRATIGRQMAGH